MKPAILNEEYLHLMTDSTENEEINEALSTEELKSVSGGIMICLPGCDVGFRKSPQGSGSGKTLKDWEKSSGGMVSDVDHPGTLQMTQGITKGRPDGSKR